MLEVATMLSDMLENIGGIGTLKTVALRKVTTDEEKNLKDGDAPFLDLVFETADEEEP
jgi:hypothetical protein